MARNSTLCLLLLLCGCASSLTVDNRIGLVRDSYFEEISLVLSREGIAAERGDRYGGITGVRVPRDDAYRALRILIQWRRGKDPGTFFTREEFESGLEPR